MIHLAIVENDEDERFFMKEAFGASSSFQIVGEFGNGDHLLEWLENMPQQQPQLIVTDLNMPGKNGYDIIAEMHERRPQIRVIATSTSSISATRERCLRLGAREFLIKPDVFTEYEGFVSQVLDMVGPELAES
ncbi:response regulator [Dyadobacter sp. CY323]|uniref:response regulator n=1 Tax=Dyadobacter sp. CY323 TaxID=2907302 RepID=UPI001F3DF8FA|nr:response regulator [Dyadobacter sp. CY323]MCE6989599.1 response regulator [Dyadobacter sp. CY323]